VYIAGGAASEMTYIVSGGALNSTHSLVKFCRSVAQSATHIK